MNNLFDISNDELCRKYTDDNKADRVLIFILLPLFL